VKTVGFGIKKKKERSTLHFRRFRDPGQYTEEKEKRKRRRHQQEEDISADKTSRVDSCNFPQPEVGDPLRSRRK